MIRPRTSPGRLLRTKHWITLNLLSSGNPHARATELLASDAMSGPAGHGGTLPPIAGHFRFATFAGDYRIRELARHAGRVVVVVHAESATGRCQRALAMIEQCPVKLLVRSIKRAHDSAGCVWIWLATDTVTDARGRIVCSGMALLIPARCPQQVPQTRRHRPQFWHPATIITTGVSDW